MCTLFNVFIVDISFFCGYVSNICYIPVQLVDMYFSEYVLMYTVKLVHLLLINGPERDKFCSLKPSNHIKT